MILYIKATIVLNFLLRRLFLLVAYILQKIFFQCSRSIWQSR